MVSTKKKNVRWTRKILQVKRRLVRVFSRPTTWQDARWIEPNQQIRQGVPVELLIDIPVAIGNARGILIRTLSIEVSAAPDYTRLPTDPGTLALLSSSVESMSIWELNFFPCRTNVLERNGIFHGGPTQEEITPVETQALDRYIGALLDSKSIRHVEINLEEFWHSAEFYNFPDLPASLGRNWLLRPGPKFSAISLRQMLVFSGDIERFAAALCEYKEFALTEINLLGDTWKNMLEILRKIPSKPLIAIFDPCGGGLDSLDRERYNLIFDKDF